MKYLVIHPFMLMVELSLILALIAHAAEAQAKTTFDLIVITIIVLANLGTVFVILKETNWQLWTFLGSGLVAKTLGSTMLYAYVGAGDGYFDLDLISENEWWIDTVRALLAVGGVFLLFGLMVEWKVDRVNNQSVIVRQKELP